MLVLIDTSIWVKFFQGGDLNLIQADKDFDNVSRHFPLKLFVKD